MYLTRNELALLIHIVTEYIDTCETKEGVNISEDFPDIDKLLNRLKYEMNVRKLLKYS